MAHCHLSQEFFERLVRTKANKRTHYMDKELVGFLLEYRPTGVGTWYFRYRNEREKTRYFRLGSTENMNALFAREEAYRIFRLVRNGEDPKEEIISESTHLTIESFVMERYLPHAKLKKRSWYIDERILKQYFFPHFAERLLHSIKRMEMVAWQNTLAEQNLQASSCNRILAVVKSVFNGAVRWGILDSLHNPCKNLSPFPENTPQARYLNKTEAKQVLTELKSMTGNISALALRLLLLTGARKQEILTARWEYVNFETRILTVPLSKSGKARYIPLSDEALNLINELSRHKKSGWLFPASSPERHIHSLYHTWNKVRARLGLHGMRIHDLRHSFASLLVISGCSLYEVQKILGHHDPRVTMRYAHLSASSLVEAANKMGKNIDISE